MNPIMLGFKAFDAHELLCHFVAEESGLYRGNALRVDLADITFVSEEELPRHWFQASCGAALASAVKGIAQRVVFVAVDRPMFWIYARRGLEKVADLRNQRLATFPVAAPPHHLANLMLSRAGLAVPRDVFLHCARDDVARLGLLKSGNVEAAVISSAVAPGLLAALGFNMLCFVGDEIRIPTTGLGIDQHFLHEEPELVRCMVDTHRQALALIHEDVELVSKVLQKYFEVATEHAEATARIFSACFTPGGKCTAETAQAAVAAMSRSLNIATSPSWQDIYQF